MKKSRSKGLPFSEWPKDDRALWEAFIPRAYDPFSKPTPVSESSLKGYCYAYSLWLTFILQRYADRVVLPVGDRVTPAVIIVYLEYLRANCREKTVGIYLERLGSFLQRVSPERDWNWLVVAGRNIRVRGQPREKHLVLSDQLLGLGLSLMEEAIKDIEQFGVVVPHTATRFRDGLMIAVLTAAPMRRGSFSKLEFGRQVCKAGEVWRIDVPADETKTQQAAPYELSEKVSAFVDIYVQTIRPELPGAVGHRALWPSRGGGPMSATLIAQSIERRTLKAFGFKVSPHRFRDAAATSIAVYDPDNVLAARDLLTHKSFTMTERHYIRAQTFQAGLRKIESNKEWLR